MKHLMNMRLLMLATLIIPLFASCGDDDENGGSNPTNGKRITKIVEETKSTIREYSFTYDDKGRIIEMEINANSAKESGTYKRFLQYGETLIISKVEATGSYRNRYNETTHTYNLSDGKIILDTGTYYDTSRQIAFTYDDSGYISSSNYIYDEETEGIPCFLKWENGNLTTYEYNGFKIECWEYNDIPWQKGLIFDLNTIIIPYTDPLLASMGYYGKLPKNLVTKYDNITYQYARTNNLVTKVIKNTEPVSNEMELETSVFNITWE